MNLMDYDAMAIGPRELALGAATLAARIDEAAFPMLSANAVISGTADLVAEPYALLDLAGHSVGVLGLTGPSPAPVAGFQVLDPESAAAQFLPQLRDAGAEAVVLLTNLEFRTAVALAARLPGIDLVVAAQPGQLPSAVTHVPGTGALAVVAEQPVVKHSGRRVGRLEVTIGPDGALVDPTWQTIAMGPELADDPQMAALLDTFRH
jgi:2',3'-cyclic-nucleotide 2'-phosphodiesterase (5'-nucleotidase family)